MSDLTGKQVKIQISTSSRFNKVEMEFAPKGRSYFWRCEMTGKIYWRLVLQARDGKTLATTPVKSFVVVPPPVTTLPLTEGSPQKFSARGLDFQWSEGKPRVLFYRYKLAKDKTFDHPLINIDIKQHSHHVDKLDAGHYFWKVGVKYSRSVPIVYSAIKEFIIQTSAKPAVAVINDDEEPKKAEDQEKEVPESKKDSPIPQPDTVIKPGSAPTPAAGQAASQTPTLAQSHSPTPPLPPPPPDLSQPPDQAHIETLEADKSLILQWNAGGEVRKFQVEIAGDAEFRDVTRVSCEPMRLGVTLKPGRFFWRVTATDGHGQKSKASAVRTFELATKIIGINLLAPEKDHQFSTRGRSVPIVFNWQVTASKDEKFIYHLQVGADSGFGKIVAAREIKAESITIDELAEGAYFWRVGAQIATRAPIQFSEISSFNIVKKDTLAEAPQLMEPADGAKMESASKELSLTLRWKSPPNSGGFIIELATGENFYGAEKFTSLQPTLDLKRAVGRYFWRVKTMGETGDEGAFSPPRSFSVTRASQSIQLKEPAPGAAVGTFAVDFFWQPLEGCVSYRLTVSASNTMDRPLRELQTKETSIQTKLDDEDTYFWTVNCSTEDGQTIRSATQSFRILING